jgi:hypothetical protein
MDTNTSLLEQARKAAGYTYEGARDAILPKLGPYCPTAQTIRTYHRSDLAPKKYDVIVVCALANLYGVGVTEVAPEMGAYLENMQNELTRSRCDSVSAGQRTKVARAGPR